MMGARKQARAWAEQQVAQGIAGLFGMLERERARKLANPHVEALFHRRMAATVTGVATRARRRWHRWLAQRWAARAWAADTALGLRSCQLAACCGIPQPSEGV